MLIVLWSTRNIKSLFPLKDKVVHRSCAIYEGQCSCKLSYIRETKRNSEIRWREHKNPAGKTEPAKHLMENTSHKFTWRVLLDAPSYFRRRILEAFFIAIRKPALNDQLEHHSLSLFRHGITKCYFVHIVSLMIYLFIYFLPYHFVLCHCFNFIDLLS